MKRLRRTIKDVRRIELEMNKKECCKYCDTPFLRLEKYKIVLSTILNEKSFYEIYT